LPFAFPYVKDKKKSHTTKAWDVCIFLTEKAYSAVSSFTSAFKASKVT
jgi:hypothetical protein